MLSNKLVYCGYDKRLFGCVVIDPAELTGNTKKEYNNRHGNLYLVERIDGDGWTLEQAGDSLIYSIMRKKYPVQKIETRTFWLINKNSEYYFIKKKTNNLENE